MQRVRAAHLVLCVGCSCGQAKPKGEKVKKHNDAAGGGWIAIAWRRGSVVGQTGREIQHQDPYHIHTDPVIPLFSYGPDYQQSAGKPCGPGLGGHVHRLFFLFCGCSYSYGVTAQLDVGSKFEVGGDAWAWCCGPRDPE